MRIVEQRAWHFEQVYQPMAVNTLTLVASALDHDERKQFEDTCEKMSELRVEQAEAALYEQFKRGSNNFIEMVRQEWVENHPALSAKVNEFVNDARQADAAARKARERYQQNTSRLLPSLRRCVTSCSFVSTVK